MEMVDVVNENDEVIGVASKKEIYDKCLPHRIVHVFVFNKSGQVALQMRSKKDNFCPGYWSTTAGGHVSSGETYEQAAKRELMEEVGIAGDLDEIYRTIYRTPDGHLKFLTVYKCVHDGLFNVCQNEVEEIRFYDPDKIKPELLSRENIHPELRFLLDNCNDLL